MPEAKPRLSQLVKAAERGEEDLTRNGIPVAQIVPVAKAKLPFGFLRNQVRSIQDSLLFETSDEMISDFRQRRSFDDSGPEYY